MIKNEIKNTYYAKNSKNRILNKKKKIRSLINNTNKNVKSGDNNAANNNKQSS